VWEQLIAGAGGLVAFLGGLAGVYVALRQEVRRSHELLQKDLGHLQSDFTSLRDDFREVRADIRRLDQKIDAVRG
jgi:hypothetical protein